MKEKFVISERDKKEYPGYYTVINPTYGNEYNVVYRGHQSPWNYCSCMDLSPYNNRDILFCLSQILQTSLSLPPASAKQSASLAKSYCPVDNDKKLYSPCFSSFYLLLSFLPCSLYLRNFAKNTKRFLFLHNIKYTNYQEITIITGTFPLPTHELHLSFQARKESYSFSAREYPLQLLMY